MDDHLFILYILLFDIYHSFLINFSQFKLKLYKSESRYSYAIARSVGFCRSIDSLSKNFRAVRWLDGILSFAQCHKNCLILTPSPYNESKRGRNEGKHSLAYSSIATLVLKAFNFGEHTFIRLYLYNSMA